ncbi:MAG: GNAT family N-acetyltransferase [Myxococcales bacterium]|nr:GNAT family N-acetyltransferase [Myxococcales bacterium]
MTMIATKAAPAAHGFQTESKGRLRVSLAVTPQEVHMAQRLRYAVFAEELGAKLHSDERDRDGARLDVDHYDAYCQHLLVRDSWRDDIVVGTTRALDARGAREAGGYYSASEFDLSRLLQTVQRPLELGRTCIHRNYRNGATINTLWRGVAALLSVHRAEILMGCASIPEADAPAVCAKLASPRFLVEDSMRVAPKTPLAASLIEAHVQQEPRIPALVAAYLRIGARVCGPPCHDPDFAVADLFMVLPTLRLARRYRSHFLG